MENQLCRTARSQPHAAGQSAAKFLRENADQFPAGLVPKNAHQLAILALNVYEVFITREDDSGERVGGALHRDIVKAVMEAFKNFETGCDG